MTQYDILLIQNVSAAGTEFSEKLVNLGKGDLLSAIATTKVPTVLAAGTNGYQLVRDDAEATGLKWVAISAGHTQNTDTGTTGADFTIDSDATEGKIKIAAVANAGQNHTMTIQNAAMTDDVTLTLPATTGTLATQAYADGLFAANDAMLFKGAANIATIAALTTYNAGWTYRVTDAGTVWGKVVEIGDLMMAIVDSAGAGNVDADWTSAQTNIDGAVIGPASTTDNYLVLFSGTTGKLIKAGSGAPGTMAYETATNYVPKSVATEQGSIFYASAAATIAELLHGSAGQVLQSGGNAANPSWLTLGTMAAATATDYITKATYNANTLLFATSDDTPAALLGTELFPKLWAAAPADKIGTGYTGTAIAGQIAKDANFIYVCQTGGTATNQAWTRSAMATNWP
jgi:hypothetical protein